MLLGTLKRPAVVGTPTWTGEGVGLITSGDDAMEGVGDEKSDEGKSCRVVRGETDSVFMRGREGDGPFFPCF